MVLKKLWVNFSYVIILLVLSFICMYITIDTLAVDSNNNQDGFVKIVADDNENLWQMAEQYKHLHQMSTEEFVAWVKEENRLKSFRLENGVELVLPIKKEQIDIRHLAGGNE